MSTEINRKRSRDDNNGSGSACLGGQAPQFSQIGINNKSDVKFGTGRETNEHRIETRQRQIQFGKNTIGYDNYLAAVPKEKRAKIQIHPRTPDPYEETSKRQFDGRVKAWRRELHKWDILDDIAKVPLQRGSAHKGDNSGNGARQTGFDGKQVLAPVTAPNSRPKAVSVSGNSERKDASFDPACAHESLGLDSPAGKRARTCGDSSSNSSGGGGQAQSTCVVGICMGEDVAALEGVDYDCEAPDDGSSDGEDVL